MKKFYFFISLILFASLVLVSCVDNTYNLVKDNLSEIRENILCYSDEDVFVTFMSGSREENYVADGISDNLVDFAVITLDFYSKDYAYNEKKVSYATTIEGVEYSGEMLNNPYDNSFVVDLSVNATDITELQIDFVIDDTSCVATLSQVNGEWSYNHLDAVQIICKDLKHYIGQYVENNQLNAECYIKVVHNTEYPTQYYWCVQIVTTNGTSMTEIINPTTGEILAKNIK